MSLHPIDPLTQHLLPAAIPDPEFIADQGSINIITRRITETEYGVDV